MSVERWHLYASEITEGAHADDVILYDRPINIRDLPGPYYLRMLEFVDAGSKSLQCRDGRGDYFQSNRVLSSALSDTNRGCPIVPPLEYAYNSVFRFDLEMPVTEEPASFWMILHGAHKIADPAGGSPYPENYRETPDTITVTVNIAHGQILKIPVHFQFNTAFAVRALTASVIFDSGNQLDVRANLRDENDQAFCNTPIPFRSLFANFDASVPVTPSPELIIPAGRAYTLELSTAGNAGNVTIQFNFSGALLSAV